jgi:aryl-alcohol dehydrogenase-like predicted oxidoreductase
MKSEDSMKFKQLGRSGLIVSDLCLGAMIFGEESERGTPPDEAEQMIHRFLDAGGNFIDTADVYADGHSEEIVGKALQGKRDQVVLATKVRSRTGAGHNDVGLSRYHIMHNAETSLRRLRTDHIDLYYMHAWDPLTPLEESLRAFDDLVTAGKVRYIGVSNFKAWQVMKALAVSDANGWVRFITGQYQYSLVKRDIEYEFSDLCPSEGISITSWSPLGGGFLSGKYTPEKLPQEGRIATTPAENEESWQHRATERNWRVLEVVKKVAQNRGANDAQVALAWLRARHIVASTIIGVRTMQQLEDNLKAANLDLTSEEIAELDKVSALPELYPYRFIERYGTREVDAELH